MDVAPRRGAAEREDFVVACPDIAHLLLGNLAVVQWRAPVRGALKYGELSDRLGDFLDRLHCGRAGADDADALAGEIDPVPRPGMRLTGDAFERADTPNVRHRRRRQDADGGDQKSRRIVAAVLPPHVPNSRFFLVIGWPPPA